ncbi:MAG: aldo/keto reductase, partial [Candidatus Aminicenantes bacterium]|nr:aldo/keto reductase [Candidatus Aminicenantes bacterium]
MTTLDRRQFLKLAGAGAAPLGLGRLSSTPPTPSVDPRQDETADGPPRIQTYRPLGRTGLKISDIGFGGINYLSPEVALYAYECGVNAFDTAEGYGQSERMLGRAMKGIRDKVVLTTKHQITTPEQTTTDAFIRRVEESLRKLQTDYVDIAMLHAVDDPAALGREEVLAAHDRLKKEGKIRFSGFSTHQPVQTLPTAIEGGRFDVVLMTYNHFESAAAEPLVARAHDKGIGTIAMKVFAGGKQGSLRGLVNDRMKYAQAALRWVLGNPAIDGLIITMSTFAHVEEYVAASGRGLRRDDLRLLARYREEAGPRYCRVSCDACRTACPHGVAVNQILRCAMYYEDYRIESYARKAYADLGAGAAPLPCGACDG